MLIYSITISILSLALSIKVLKHKSVLGWNSRPLPGSWSHARTSTLSVALPCCTLIISLTLLWKAFTKAESSMIAVNLMIVHGMIGTMILMPAGIARADII